ncbi:MAG: carbon-nitrogen hydrolase family protein [Planctomycetota bacterium]
MAYPISVVQLDIDYAHPAINREAALALTADAIARGARLVVLPEACVSDYFRGTETLAESIPGPLTESFAQIAGSATIALPLLEKSSDGSVFSSCALIRSDGVTGVARKTHLFYDSSGLNLFRDDDMIRAGDDLTVFDAGDMRVGIVLGFDADFPEIFRTLALKGADAIVVALNAVEPDIEFLRGMAKRNRVAIAVANRVGFKRIYPAAPEYSAAASPILQDKRGEFLIRCKGGSAIIGPDGSIVAAPIAHEPEGGDNTAIPARVKIPRGHFQEESVLTAAFVIDELRVQRLTHSFVTARRVELYSEK